jgi:hypothetical protein
MVDESEITWIFLDKEEKIPNFKASSCRKYFATHPHINK